jgi:release factor glutamine methyltransferase
VTLLECIQDVATRFARAGIDSARLDAELLAAYARGCDRLRLLVDGEMILSDTEIHVMRQLFERRLTHEPIAYITGKKEFFGLEFGADPRALIPRPETEMLVELAARIAPREGRALDLCTGSGAVAVALNYERPDLDVTGSDLSVDAIELARENGLKLLKGNIVSFIVSDCYEAFHGERYNVITANPPYVDSVLDGTLQRELSFEPGLALYASDGGMSVIRRILEKTKDHLALGGMLLMEIGSDQGMSVGDFVRSLGLSISISKDLAGHDRIAKVTYND